MFSLSSTSSTEEERDRNTLRLSRDLEDEYDKNIPINVNFTMNGKTILMIALDQGKGNIAQKLLKGNRNLFDWEINSKAWFNAFNAFLKLPNEQFFDILSYLTYVIDINVQNNRGKTPLMMVIQNLPLNERFHSLLKVIVNRNSLDLNVRDYEQENTALMIAINNSQPSIVSLVLNASGKDLNIRNKEGKTALFFAVRKNDYIDAIKIVNMLLNHRYIDVDIRYRNGATILDAVLFKGSRYNIWFNYVILELLVRRERHAHIQPYSKYLERHRNRPDIKFIINDILETGIVNNKLHDQMREFCPGGFIESTKWILSLFPVLAWKPIEDLFVPARRRLNKDRMEWILDHTDIDVNRKTSNGFALTEAAFMGRIDIIRMLLNRENINVNVQDDKYIPGSTALILAVRKRFISIVRLLLRVPNINVNIQNKKGNTAFFYAVSYRPDMEMVRMLASVPNLNVELINKNGESAFDLVMFNALTGDERFTRKVRNDYLEIYNLLYPSVVGDTFPSVTYEDIIEFPPKPSEMPSTYVSDNEHITTRGPRKRERDGDETDPGTSNPWKQQRRQRKIDKIITRRRKMRHSNLFEPSERSVSSMSMDDDD